MLFDRLDANGDGVITRSEFTTALKSTDNSPEGPTWRSDEMNGMEEVDTERQRLRDEIAAAADAAEMAMHQTTTGGASSGAGRHTAPMEDYDADRRQVDFAPQDAVQYRDYPQQDDRAGPAMPIHDSWLSDGTSAEPGWIDRSYTFAGPPPQPRAKADPVAEALLRVCWEAIHYRRRTLWNRPIDSLESFYAAVESQPAVVSTRLGPQLRDIREGLHRLDIGLTNAQLDRLIATAHTDAYGGVSFDDFSRWLHVRSSDAGIIEAANIPTNWDPATEALSNLGEGPPTAQLQAIAQLHLKRQDAQGPPTKKASTKRGRTKGVAAQLAADRQRSRSPTKQTTRPASARATGSRGSGLTGRGGQGRRATSAGRGRRAGGGGNARASQHRSHASAWHGVEPTDGATGRPGAWDRMQSANHAQTELGAGVQRELQRVLWDVINYQNRTL